MAKPLVGLLIVASVLLILTLCIRNLSCPADKLEGGGELRVTGAVNTTVRAPAFIQAGSAIDESTSEAAIILARCGDLLSCESCPLKLAPGVNASGAILVYVPGPEEEVLNTCGLNRIARGFEWVLAGLAAYWEVNNPLVMPGFDRKRYALGEHRDAVPHDGDAGIAFPHVMLHPYQFAAVSEALQAGEHG